MSDGKKIISRYRKVMKLMELQRRTLSDAGSNKDILEIYSAVLNHLAQLSQENILGLIARQRKGTKAKNRKSLSGVRTKSLLNEDIEKSGSLSLEEVEKLATDETTPRKVLEGIAVGRFQVPRGSLRSYSNIRSLREKILTRVQNERGHITIKSVAQRTQKR